MLQKKEFVFGAVVLKIIKTISLCYILGVAIIALDGIRVTQHGDNKQAKFAIVYGSKIELDGKPSKRLQARLDTAADLYRANEVEKIIVSGGIGIEGFDEAEVMKRYLIEQGVKIPRIIVDSEGYNTSLTSYNAYEINKEVGNYPHVGIVAVSQFFHISRIKLSLRRAGFVHIGSISPEYYEPRDIYSVAREVPAYITYFFSGFFSDLGVSQDEIKIIGGKAAQKISEKIDY